MDAELLSDLIAIQQKALEQMQLRIHRDLLGEPVPAVGSAASMRAILEAFDGTSRGNGKTQAEASAIAKRAGIKPQGLAGYFRNQLLEADIDADSRWITEAGKERLAGLRLR